MHYKSGKGRETPLFLEESLPENSMVRLIEAFVDSLDFKALQFTHATLPSTGTPPYHPADLVKLYIYGYCHRVHSSRRLEQETIKNLEVLWLLKQLRPNFRTISNFRRDNAESLKTVCLEFTLLCKDLSLFSGELVAIDGSKFRASNSRSKNFTKSKLTSILKDTKEDIQRYFKDLELHDSLERKDEQHQLIQESLKKKLEYCQKSLKKHEELMQKLEQSGESQISLTDPDSRSMKTPTSCEVCYNVQIAVDEKYKLIVAHEVTNEVTDLNQLAPMAVKAQEVIGEVKKSVADRGYYTVAEVEKCLEAGIIPYVKKQLKGNSRKTGLFGKEVFQYDSEKDCYICPAHERLEAKFKSIEYGQEVTYYVTPKCNGCPLRAKCTSNKKYGRRITRGAKEHLLEEMELRVLQESELMKRRSALVEHPFGTLKGEMRHRQFLTRGLKKVGGEMALLILGYNLKRVWKLLGSKKLLEAVALRKSLRQQEERVFKRTESQIFCFFRKWQGFLTFF